MTGLILVAVLILIAWSAIWLAEWYRPARPPRHRGGRRNTNTHTDEGTNQ